uniref:Large ribosomal subunit protein uL13c n=1 Tax=Gracilariopsis longissima TaxID=172976 RepID=A0A345U9Q6_9FLOR|nr:ribosomal protein L13 [Gracilariopsis longissima]AXI97192.1 ribosomal protein L13 [Gracilariopsis longissima]UAD89108.1 ribosomal protein L13 [Gracilariopsis longissima]
MNKTYIPQIKINHQWYIINAENQNLGRLSSRVAQILKGKSTTTYSSHLNSNIHIILLNSKLINITGKKKLNKIYKKHSGYPGGLKIKTFNEIQTKQPNKILEKSIRGMLPKGPLGRQLFRQLKIYPENLHPHKAQKPQIIKLDLD